MPFLSIVTPCLNAAPFIEEAIRSVLDQDYADVEHIVVDGGSTDGTLEVVARYPHLKVIEQRDNCLYEALNHGVEVAQGRFIGHLNADDCYLPGAFRRVHEAGAAVRHAELVSGAAVVGRDGRDRTGRGKQLASRPLDIASITFGVPAINARFIARTLYGWIGLYDTRYSRAADREFLLRAVLAGAVNVQLDDAMYWYRSHGGSLTIGGNRRRYLSVGREHMDIAHRYLADPRVQGADRAEIRRWHSEAATLEVADALIAGQLAKVAATVRGAVKVDTLALPRMLRFGTEKLARMMLAGGRNGDDSR